MQLELIPFSCRRTDKKTITLRYVSIIYESVRDFLLPKMIGFKGRNILQSIFKTSNYYLIYKKSIFSKFQTVLPPQMQIDCKYIWMLLLRKFKFKSTCKNCFHFSKYLQRVQIQPASQNMNVCTWKVFDAPAT